MLKLGVDVGGTFTDVLVLAENSDELTIAKVLSTPDDQSAGVIAGIAAACEKRGISPSELELILHGSTVVTNMILESKGAAGGLVTTAGHEQVLHLARAWTPGPLYGWMGMEKPPPLVPLWRTKPVVGRLSATGEEVEPLDEAAVKTAVEELLADGVESLTISLLNSYVNPVHERRARELAREVAPDMPVSIASDLVSEYREYERTLTAVINSYVQPQVIKYLDHLESQLDDQGFAGRLNIVRSDGGTMSAKATKDKPVDVAFSGPSGGAVGASYVARMIDVPNVLTFDMGGTSTDVALCYDGEVAVKREAELGYYQFQARTADIHSVGAGGGSIAYLNLAGALRVGPASAGAVPGPACYGQGGEEPTVTDANVVLGRLPGGSKLGGSLELDVEAAKTVVGKLAKGLGIDVAAAAQAVLDIANENMHAALRVVSVERGYDPRELGLVAFGGAGPLHANALLRLIGATKLIVPASPGVLSAFGFIAANVQNEFAQTYLRVAEETPADHLRGAVDGLIEEGRAWLAAEEIPESDQAFTVFADCRYLRQDIQIPCSLELEEITDGYVETLRGKFEAEHARRFGFELDAPIEIATLRIVGRGVTPDQQLGGLAGGDDAVESLSDREEPVYFGGKSIPTPIYERERLRAGHRLAGPAIVVQEDTTTVIEPGYAGTVDEFANIIIQETESEGR
ncbi:MAG: hydantoinase/oxoprolinase family protein [Thermoleophilia bacterium]|nr:hydantoinase/oxoprolinase family protein [Thermoleophilia bacterium]